MQAMLVDGVDYVSHANVKNPKGGRPPVDYLVSLDAAKQLCMMSNWIKDQIVQAMLVDGVDYCLLHENVKREKGSSVRTEYLISLDARDA